MEGLAEKHPYNADVELSIGTLLLFAIAGGLIVATFSNAYNSFYTGLLIGLLIGLAVLFTVEFASIRMRRRQIP